ncbi:DUF5701 family protein [Geodermatophilus marinus]|uniref:DUF5701 family protein n=1 Tax=Geodermatophilus sp. LHW52908 TaxID=2303986 RepID=UPI000E3EB113|nr:DUF5701 family protein [Geodermatophilus sp. LHW52908]RFU20730.1 hypothetical protein D0Z06_14325 [Geodermatophilus sp. LHW52908]
MLPTLPSPAAQAERLLHLGVAELAGVPAEELQATAAGAPAGLLVLPVAPSALTPLVEREGHRAFVVTDMTDVDEFAPAADVTLPAGAAYLVEDPARGDDLLGLRPVEALPLIAAAGRTPLTLAEGLSWLLQCPGVLARNACFMTLGSRRRRPDGSLDPRTPALWLSNGTGRDGAARRGAPKVGWCWAGNRHTWLGFATGARRRAL